MTFNEQKRKSTFISIKKETKENKFLIIFNGVNGLDEIIVKQGKMAKTIKRNYTFAHFVEIIKNNEEKCKKKLKLKLLFYEEELNLGLFFQTWLRKGM